MFAIQPYGTKEKYEIAKIFFLSPVNIDNWRWKGHAFPYENYIYMEWTVKETRK